MLQWWTLGRATGTGAVAGLAALLLWPLYASFQDPILPAYALALAVSAFCGVSILWITAADLIFHRRRGERLIPLRLFDIAFALLLTVPPLLALEGLF